MDLDSVMSEALQSGPGVATIACADVRSGLVLGASAVEDPGYELVSDAATGEAELSASPSFGAEVGAAGAPASPHWIHAYARVSERSELVVVGVAHSEASPELLLDCVKRVAGELEAAR